MSRVLAILFNTDMVRAILDGEKTATRRVCKDVNDYTVPDMSFYDAGRRTYAVHNYADKGHTDQLSLAERTCPICPGDILYVRETWSYDVGGIYIYKASYAEDFTGNKEINAIGNKIKWYPSIHMPKEAARIWLKVTDVRVERLQNMMLDDFLAEGVAVRPEAFNDLENAYGQARERFKKIWNSTIKKSALDFYGWEANPWVWVIEFERHEKPESEG